MISIELYTSLISTDDSHNLPDVLSNLLVWSKDWHLKAHKSDGHSGLSRNHIINASDLFFTNLALLFSYIVINGKVPDSYLLSTVVQYLRATM